MTTHKLESINLSKAFSEAKTGKTISALEDVSIYVDEGELICILGPSGCGKSTFLNIAAGFTRPTEGKVLFDGKPITAPGPDRGVVFQEFALFPWRTAIQNIEFGLEMKGVRKESRCTMAKTLVDLVGLSGFEDKYPIELSGGMKQRVGIARALALDPEILLMDEPFGALDAQTRRVMQSELLNILAVATKTVLFVTHSIDEALLLADRVVVMTAGPGRVKGTLKVDLPHPRKRTDAGYVELFEEVDNMITVEVKRAMRETPM